MGNSAGTCFRCRGKVRVVLLNGDVVEFKQPVTASTVMRKYPEHLVLHCSMASGLGIGQRRRISVLKPEKTLKANQSYVIMSIHSVKNSRPFLDTHAFFALNACNAKMNSRIAHTSKPKKWWWIHKVFAKIFWSSHTMVDRSHHEESTQPLLGGYDRPPIRSRSSFKDDQEDWRPSLERIPESPNHSPLDLSHRSHNSSNFRSGHKHSHPEFL